MRRSSWPVLASAKWPMFLCTRSIISRRHWCASSPTFNGRYTFPARSSGAYRAKPVWRIAMSADLVSFSEASDDGVAFAQSSYDPTFSRSHPATAGGVIDSGTILSGVSASGPASVPAPTLVLSSNTRCSSTSSGTALWTSHVSPGAIKLSLAAFFTQRCRSVSTSPLSSV